MFWMAAMVALVSSYPTRGFVPVVIFLALAGILLRLARERRQRLRLFILLEAAKKPR